MKTASTSEELHERYREANEPVERIHWRILWLVKQDHAPREVAELPGYSAGWMREGVRRWHEVGSQRLADHRRALAGANPLLSVKEQRELARTLEQPPPDGGL